MIRDAGSIEAAHAAIRELTAEKLRYLAPLTIIFLVGYIGLTALAGFAKGVMGLKVIGGLNLGFVLIACNYVLSWALAIIYVRLANRVFDPKAREAAAAISGAGGST